MYLGPKLQKSINETIMATDHYYYPCGEIQTLRSTHGPFPDLYQLLLVMLQTGERLQCMSI